MEGWTHETAINNLEAEVKALKLQVDGLQKENVNLREAIRGEREKNGVISQWLVEEGDKLKESNRLNEEQQKKLEELYDWAEGHWDHNAPLLLKLRAILRKTEKRKCEHPEQYADSGKCYCAVCKERLI